ncbi:MAG: signal peptidase II [Acholeplasmataceae bacterium]
MIIGVILIVSIVILDHLSKLWIVYNVAHSVGRITIIDGFFQIVQHHNYGVAWGQMQNNFLVLYIIPIIALAAFIYMFRSVNFKTKWFYSIAITLFIGGTIGNYIDRVFRGYVVDFLDFNIFGYDFPTFNVADMALTAGVIAFAIDAFFFEHKRNEKINEKNSI